MTETREIDQMASLARTALTDPAALPDDADADAAMVAALNTTTQHAYAVARLDEIINALNPAELTHANAADTLTLLGRHVQATLERLEAEGLLEAGRSTIADLITGGLDLLDGAIGALRDCEEVHGG